MWRDWSAPARAFRRALAIFAAASAGALAGCFAPGPMDGAALERLKASVKAAQPGAIRVMTAGRNPGAAGPTAAVVMPFVSAGKQLAEFPLYDGYFKVAFALAEELRDLGFDATLAPRIWAARDEATAYEMRGLDDTAVERNLSAIAAQEEIQALYRLSPTERRSLLVSRAVYISARSAVPSARWITVKPAPREVRPPTAREMRKIYFAADDAPPPRYDFEAEVLELSVTSEGALGAEEPPTPTTTAVPKGTKLVPARVREGDRPAHGERRAHAKIALKISGRNGVAVAAREVSCDAVSDETGITFRKLGAQYSFAMGADDPLDRAIRGCVRVFVAEALPKLGGAGQ